MIVRYTIGGQKSLPQMVRIDGASTILLFPSYTHSLSASRNLSSSRSNG